MHRRLFIQKIGQGLALSTLALTGAFVWQRTAFGHEPGFFEQSFPNLAGQDVSIAQYANRALVVNFWASWCPPCVEEMPDLDRLSRQFPQVQFLGLAIDTKRNVNKFLEHTPVNYDLLIPGHAGVQTMRALGNSKGGLPYTVLFNAQGQQQTQVLGQIDPVRLSDDIKQLA